jgi:hypothetical protein
MYLSESSSDKRLPTDKRPYQSVTERSVTKTLKRLKRHPLLRIDNINLMWPANLTIANLLPADAEAPDWKTPEARETPEFEKFLDERFPREKFLKFRRMIDGPSLIQMSVREQEKGVQVAVAPRARLANYRYIVEIRRIWRAAARIGSVVAAIAGKKRPQLRICEFCQLLFIAGRNNQKVCDKKCGAALRQRRKRAKAKEYELHRELNISRKNDEQRKRKKGA